MHGKMKRNTTGRTATIIILLILLCIGGCWNVTTSQSMSFAVETGDCIRTTLDTTQGYSLAQDDGMFLVKNGDEIILQGIFQTRDQYEAQEAMIRGTPGVQILSESNNMLSYYYKDGAAGPEVGYLFLVDDSDTGVYLASLMDQQKADQAFARMSFEKVSEK
ncbi:MAG TPA: hypothetical protein H9717_05665 [Candidatus Eisenbergiella merdipullorum]|uniref:Uncharacterized protein n=1 Tax=Candidatus Eisenbergiella merdipullorum TaxID=2838553 RepID=A0A9D2I6F3_9FIRM|nr:hypothetical protein [Candidatus Eisenbergiella merdipullorum]